MPSTLHSADRAAALTRRSGPFARSLPWLLLVGGVIGLAAAFVLTVEKFALALDPAYAPTCSINPVLNCGSVMDTPQASAFGFPNSLLGIAGFAVVAAVGAALLAGAVFAQWFWRALQVGVTAAAGFVHWLIVQSLYDIGALCPYCMVAWVAAMVALLATASQLARAGRLPRFLASYAPSIMFGWVALMLLLIFLRFSDYWLSLI